MISRTSMSRSNQKSDPDTVRAENEGDPTLTFGRGAEGRANALAYLRAVSARSGKARSLRLPDDAWKLLEAEAKRRKVSLSKLVRVIIARYLYARPLARPKRP